MSVQTPPRWDLTNVYPSLSSNEYASDFGKFKTSMDILEKLLEEKAAKTDKDSPLETLIQVGEDLTRQFNHMLVLAGTLRAYLESFRSTDSYNKEALKKQSEYEMAAIKMDKIQVLATEWIGRVASRLPEMLNASALLNEHAYFLEYTAEQSKYQMSPQEEVLASELSLSGSNAWSKLQGIITSQLSVEMEIEGKTQKLPAPALINLRSHPDGEIRRKGYEAENKLWESVKQPLAACLNGIKGEVNTLNKHRNRKDALHSAIDYAHIDRETLETMLSAMQDSFPMFRRYFKAKARLLGKENLPWWDLFAPVGQTKSDYTFSEARDFILENFGKFSPELEGFASHAFEKNWIDAEQRDGKRGGAFCMEVPAVGESRILSNFDGSQDQVSTLAHELGHGFHNYCAIKAGKTELQKMTPMTLAETASIMCETIVSNASLKNVLNVQEELGMLETQLNGDSQVIVDIYSRYLFEKEIFERRAEAELDADEICAIMEKAQKATYGDGLDERYLQKWMWTWKPHYYSGGLSFYNFPYAFGLLFATGLYAIYQQRGPAFVNDFMDLLASTGEASAADLAARFGIDIRAKTFWEDSLNVIEKHVDRYCELVN